MTVTGDDEQIKQFLSERDVPCPACGYNLRGLEGDACPECNERLSLRIGLVEPKQGAFIAGLIGLAVGIGFCVAFLSLAAIVGALRGGAGGLLAESWPLVLNLVLESAALAGWVKGRRWLRRLAPQARVNWAVACWVLSVGLAGMFFVYAFKSV